MCNLHSISPPCNMGWHLVTPGFVTVRAGICHTDYHQVNDEWGGGIFPMVPGHEIVGIVTEVGPKVKSLKPGDRVGVGCFVESCMKCDRYSSPHSVAVTSAGHHALFESVVRGLQRAHFYCCSMPSQLQITLARLSLQGLRVLVFCIVRRTCPHDGTVCLCSACWCLLALIRPGHNADLMLQVQKAGGELLPQVCADLQCQGLPWRCDIWRLQHTPGGA